MAERLYVDLKTFDELAKLQDSTLATRMRNIRQMIEQAYKHDQQAYRLEVELCYAEREFDIRARRQLIHSSFNR